MWILRRELGKRTVVVTALACLLAVACSCSSHAGGEGLHTQGAPTPSTTSASANTLSFNLTNFTGSALHAVYVSPGDSKGWEENVLGNDELNDGDTIDIRFSPEESAALWDIRVESADAHYAEWKGIDLRGVSRITLLLNMSRGAVVTAEVE